MSDVLDFFRSEDPRFKNVSDDELTAFVGREYPKFLQDPGFKSDFEKVSATKTPETQTDNANPAQEAQPAYQQHFDAVPEIGAHKETLQAGEDLTRKYLTARDMLSNWAPEKIPQLQADYEKSLKGLGFSGVGDTDENLTKPFFPIEEPKGDTIRAGIDRALAKIENSFQTPESIALLGAAGAFPNLARAVFGGMALSGAATDLGTAAGTQGKGNIAEAIIGGLINSAFAGELLIPDKTPVNPAAIVSKASDQARSAGAPLTAKVVEAVTSDKSTAQEDLKGVDVSEDFNLPGPPGPKASTEDSSVVQPEAEAKTKGVESNAQISEEFQRQASEGDQARETQADDQQTEGMLSPPTLRPGENQGEGMTGMGAAVPSEFEHEPINPTGIRNAEVDTQRENRGLPPAMQPARKGFGTVWDQAMTLIDNDPTDGRPGAQDVLMDELRTKPRALTDVEDALLLHRQIDLQNEYQKEVEIINQAHEDGRMEDAEAARLRMAELSDRLLDIYNIGKQAGTETGRGLNARRMLAHEDFSLSKMVTERRADRGGKPLTPEEEAQTRALHDQIEKTQKAYDDHVARTDDRIRQLEIDKALEQAKREEAERPKYAPSILEHAERIVKKIEAMADAARKRLAGKSFSPTPEMLADTAMLVASHIARGTLEAAKLGAMLVKEFGEGVKPYIDQILKDAHQIIDDHSKDAAEPVKRLVKKVDKKDAQAVKTATMEAIKERLDEGRRDEITSLVAKLSRGFVADGIVTRDALIDAIHDVLKGIDPTITRREAMDAISGYGDFKQLTKDEISVKLRDLKGQMQQVSKLEDMTGGKAPLKTGVERRTPSDEERRLTAQVNELKKKGGFTVTDPAKQLKTALDAKRTRLKNQISDLSHEIATRTKIVKNKQIALTDAEVETLIKERDSLKATHREIFGDKKMSDENRLKVAMRSAEKSLAEYERKIKENDLSSTPKTKRLSTPELESVRGNRDAAREILQSLRDADTFIQHEKNVKELERSIAEYERRIKTGDIFSKDKSAPEPDLQEVLLRQKRDKLAVHLKAMREASSEGRAKALADAIESTHVAMEETARRINEGDVSSKSKTSSKVSGPELDAMRAEHEQMQKMLRELQSAAKRKDPELIKTDRISKMISEVERQIREKDYKFERPESKPDSPAVTELKKTLSDARERLSAAKEATSEMRDKKLAEALDAVEKASSELERKINEGDLAVRSNKPLKLSSSELDSARAEHAELNKILQQMRNAAKPRKSAEEISLQAFKTYLVNSELRYRQRIENGDFISLQRKNRNLDDAAVKLKAANEKAKQDYLEARQNDRMAKRSDFEKSINTLVKWRRGFLLSGWSTLAKLTSAGLERMGFTAAEELVGAGLSKLPGIRGVARMAPREGGGSVSVEAKALTEGFVKGMADAWQTLKTGKSDLDLIYGKRDVLPRSVIDFFGSVHGALKSVTKRNEFVRSFQKRVEFEMRKGGDPSDPMVQTKIALEAYKDAQRSIFLQDNRVVSAYKRALSALKEPNKVTKKPSTLGQGAAAVAQALLPIVKVPTNIIAETFQYTFGSVTGSAGLLNAMRKGINTLHPEEADLIMRQLKKGSLGMAGLVTGWFLADQIGGYYQSGEKRKDSDVKAGRIRMFGHDIPSMLIHSPLLETLQIGATVRRVTESKLRKKDQESQGMMAGIMAALFGLTEEVPFARGAVEAGKLFNARERGQYISDTVRSAVIPQGVEQTAKFFDKNTQGETVKRKPTGIVQNIEVAIPGLRKNVPEKR